MAGGFAQARTLDRDPFKLNRIAVQKLLFYRIV